MSTDKRNSAKQPFEGPAADTSDRIAAISPQRGAIGHGVLEAATWLAVMSSALLTYALAGVVGFGQSARGGALSAVFEQVDGDFSRNFANPAYLAVIVLLGLASFLPLKRVRSMEPSQRTLILTITAIVTGLVLIVFGIYSTAWMGAIASLFLGALISLQVIHTPELHTKPWRAGTVAAAVFFFIGAIAQIRGGVGAGMSAVPWVVFASGIVVILAGVLIIVSPLQRSEIPTTGSFPFTRAMKQARAHADVGTPWPVYALYGVIGSIFVAVIPTASDESFGVMSLGLMVCAVLIGWAAGYEAGPTFAPGMTRPRLTSFALIGAGVLALVGGMVHEVSGATLLFAAAAFAVGVGVRAQDYSISRRIGMGIGMIITLLLLSLDARFTVPLSEASQWVITGSSVAVASVGLLAIAGGIAALFLFSPTGIQGIGVDIVHAFRSRATAGQDSAAAQSAPSAVADRSAGTPGAHGLRAPQMRTADRGFFIAVEGPDGSGKTTQIEFIGKHLAERGLHNVELTREPGGTDKGVQIRGAILDGAGVTPKSEALLYAADRSHHVHSLIEPTLRSGGVVVTDRYIDSSVAYQAAGRELGESDIFALSAWGTDGLMPNLTLLLDISPEASAQRTAKRGDENHLDKQPTEFRQRVRDRFLSLAKENPQRYVVINADQPADKVSADIARALDTALDAAGLGRTPQQNLGGAQVASRGGSTAERLTSDDPNATQAMPSLDDEAGSPVGSVPPPPPGPGHPAGPGYPAGPAQSAGSAPSPRPQPGSDAKETPASQTTGRDPEAAEIPLVKPAEDQQKPEATQPSAEAGPSAADHAERTAGSAPQSEPAAGTASAAVSAQQKSAPATTPMPQQAEQSQQSAASQNATGPKQKTEPEPAPDQASAPKQDSVPEQDAAPGSESAAAPAPAHTPEPDAAPAHAPESDRAPEPESAPDREPAPEPVPDADDILPGRQGANSGPDAADIAADDDAATRILPSQPQQSAEKLRRQAEIERQARERLRQARHARRDRR